MVLNYSRLEKEKPTGFLNQRALAMIGADVVRAQR
jgi:hypothetical protein